MNSTGWCQDEISFHTKSCVIPCYSNDIFSVTLSHNNSYLTKKYPWEGVGVFTGDVYNCSAGYGIYLLGEPLEFYSSIKSVFFSTLSPSAEGQKLAPALFYILLTFFLSLV